MDDGIYNIKKDEDGTFKLLFNYKEELPNNAIFYTNSGECQQKVMVDRKVYYIILHSTLFSGGDTLNRLTQKQLKLFYNISKAKLR